MGELKATKGEWSVVDGEAQKTIGVWSSESNCIIEINYHFWDEEYQNELKVNAHLISQAPAMYAEIENDISFFECLLIDAETLGEQKAIQHKINLKLELLAKARGE